MAEVVLDIADLAAKLELEHIHVPIVACGIENNARAAVAAIRAGAKEYIPLPPDPELIAAVLSAVADDTREMIYRDDAMANVVKLAQQVAGSEASVLITGESGTGKEVLARFVHARSNRSRKPFISINCAAIPEHLLESELFGHEKGSFTGAHADKKGLFEIADRGSLFLDEIAELDVAMQAKLLRALQERKIRRVGGTHEIGVDVRVIAATNRDLRAMVADGRFRDDLYYRINVLSVDVPPLRERREDIPVLIDFFLKKHTRNTSRLVRGLTPETKKLMNDYSWPGNVRQLESAIERAILLCEGDQITVEDLPLELRQDSKPAAQGVFKLPPEGISFEDVERDLLTQAMEQTDYNITKAAKLLGFTFRTLQYRLEKFGIKKPEDKKEATG
jgi:DNA-binding NtrC family response regulator